MKAPSISSRSICSGKLVLAVGLLVALVTGTGAAQDGLAMLKIDPGARPAGMAGAFVAMAGDPNGIIYNPAASVGMTRFAASFSHVEYWNSIRLENGFFATPLSGKWSLHGAVRFANLGDLEFRTSPSSVPLGQFEASDVSFKLGAGYQMTPKLAVGAAGGWVMEKIEGWRGSSANLDFGFIYQIRPDLSVGAAANYLGSSFILEKAGAPGSRDIELPTTYRVGATYVYREYRGALDLAVVDDELRAHFGAEARIHELLTLRAGYMANYDTKNFTAGLTVRHRTVSFDYGFVPYTDNFGTTHLFSVTFTL